MCELNEDDILRVVSAITRNVLDDGNSVDGDTAPNLLRDNWPESRSLRTTRAVTHARLERRRRRSRKIAHRAMQVKFYMNKPGPLWTRADSVTVVGIIPYPSYEHMHEGHDKPMELQEVKRSLFQNLHPFSLTFRQLMGPFGPCFKH